MAEKKPRPTVSNLNTYVSQVDNRISTASSTVVVGHYMNETDEKLKRLEDRQRTDYVVQAAEIVTLKATSHKLWIQVGIQWAIVALLLAGMALLAWEVWW